MATSSTCENPYDWYGEVVYPKIFAGRMEELQIINDEISRLANVRPISPRIAIVGERRVGKTSLLLRVQEMCAEYALIGVLVSVTKSMAVDPDVFWQELLSELLLLANQAGISIRPEPRKPIGFQTGSEEQASDTPALDDLWYRASSDKITGFILQHDLEVLHNGLAKAGYKGIVIMLDEAQNLVDSVDVTQQLRNVFKKVAGYGIVFAGESYLSTMFVSITTNIEPLKRVFTANFEPLYHDL